MKIRCEKKDLQLAVSNVSRAAPAKSPIPALEGILFEADRTLLLTAYQNWDLYDPGSGYSGERKHRHSGPFFGGAGSAPSGWPCFD